MNNIFSLAGIISIVYFLLKFLEMRFIYKQVKPLKELIQEALHVYISSAVGLFIADQFEILKHVSFLLPNKTDTQVFVDSPGF